MSKTNKNLKTQQDKKTYNPNRKQAEDMKRHFTKEDTQMAEKHMEGCLTSLAIQEMQIKATMSYHYVPLRTAKIKKSDTTKCW